MDFNEWLKEHEREVFKRNQGCFDKAYIFGAKNGFKAGQQSKQAEIDELQKRINDALNEIDSEITGKHHVKRIINILKGAAE